MAFQGNMFDEEEDSSYHVITTDNKYMGQLGLSSFTTGTLYKWWNDNNGTNRKFFSSWDPQYAPNLLFFTPSPFLGTYSISGVEIFVNEPGTGSQYKKFTMLPIGAAVGNYGSWSHESAKEGEPPYNSSHNGVVAFEQIHSSKADMTVSDATFSIPFLTSYLLSPTTPHSDDVISKILDPSHNHNGITTLIEANNYIVKKMTSTKNKIDDSWHDSDKFLLALTSDIKTSKNKFLQWTISVPFNFNANSAGSCVKIENVTFRLYLFDTFSPRNGKRTLALPNNTTLGISKSPTGEPTGGEIAAPVQASYDASSGKWSYGTEIIMAKVKETITGAKKSASVDQISANEKDTFFTDFGTGIAIPIINKNGDPRVWSPEFTKVSCGDTQLSKPVELTIYNPHTDAISKDEIIYIIQRSGRWFPIRMSPASDVDTTRDNRWSFTYLMANRDSYFRKFNQNGSVRSTYVQFEYSEYETDFRDYYHDSDSTYLPTFGIGGPYNQVTSFDFMDISIGGTHPDGNTIRQTNFIYKYNGNKHEQDNEGFVRQHGFQQFPFFGCVFPAGYKTGDPGRLHFFSLASPDSTGVILSAQNDNPNADFEYFKTDIAQVYPFSEDPSRDLLRLGEGGFEDPSMFYGAEHGSLLLHLPADIALNASPSGTYGSPIVKTDMITTINEPNKIQFKKGIHKYLVDETKQTWLSNGNSPLDKFKSAYDIPPFDDNTIQFRPLLLETYATSNMPSAAFATSSIFGAICPTKRRVIEKSRLYMGNDPATSFNHKVISDNFFTRNSIPLMQRYGEFYNTVPQNLCHGLSFAAPEGKGVFDAILWDQDWNRSPAQGIGIIAASCTKSFKNKIQFDTTCFLGRSNNIILNSKYPTWGSSATIKDFNTTCLFVRIFHNWPKKQTIFDPRVFSVFHFNEGIENFDNNGIIKPTISPQHRSGSKIAPTNNGFVSPQTYPTGDYNVDDMMIGAYRVPTYYNKTTVSDDINVWSDQTSSTQTSSTQPLRKRKDWNIDTKEVGVLLPYDKIRSILTISLDNIYINNQGSNYSLGDKFTIAGGSGTGTIIKVKQIGVTGNITELEIVYAGEGYESSDFPTYLQASNQLLSFTTNALKLKLVPIVKKNSSAIIYITQGKVMHLYPKKIDGPKEVKSPLLLSADTAPTEEGIITATKSKSFVIKSENRSPNDSYDIFFHFHNDISHTMAYAIDFGGMVPSYQQFIETSMSFD